MSDSLVQELLRRLDGKMDQVLDDMADLKSRMTSLETQAGSWLATESARYTITAQRLDRAEARLDWIEQRLGRVERKVGITTDE